MPSFNGKRETSAIFVAAFIGVDVLLRIDFDLTAGPATFLKKALDGLREKLARWHGELPAFGRATGIIVNYSPDHAIQFDLRGNPIPAINPPLPLIFVSMKNRGNVLDNAGG